MRYAGGTLALIGLGCLCMVNSPKVAAQGYDTPLTIQGLNQTSRQSATSRGAGGITIGVRNDIAVMFANPALLRAPDGIHLSLGGANQSTYSKQEQVYGGLQSHSAFNLLTQGVTGDISDPDTILGIPTASDTVQRPFDSIGPNWNRSKSNSVPLQLFIAVPFEIEEIPLVAGAGFAEYANLSRFYQNNNCFSPSVLSVLNGTISTTTLNANPYKTQWYQYAQQRDGSIYGYGLALSAVLFEKLSVGVSGMMLIGSTDDLETRVGRGLMAFYQNYLRLSKNDMTSYTKAGTSDYSGVEFTLGAKYRGKNVEFGFAVKPPTTITRSYSGQMSKDSVTAVSRLNHRVDSLHAFSTTSISGEDEMWFPWRGTVGISIFVQENLTVGVEYEVRSYASAVYTDPAGAESNPWVSASLWHLGVEYRPADWLALRVGVHEDAEVYEPLSNAIRGEAVKFAVYSAGVGVTFANIHVNLAYEYGDMKYVDTWSNAASINREFRQNLVADVSYAIPW
jgi:hypothetical protein